MDKMMKECFKPHALVHSLAGLGVGLLLVGWMPNLAMNGVMYGLIVIVLAIVLDFMVQSGKK